MTRIVVLFSNFGPYHLARINAFHQYCSSKRWEVFGVELARSEADYAWQVDLNQENFSIISIIQEELESVSSWHILTHLCQTLSKLKPDVVAIAGYARPSMLIALWWCLLSHKIAILFSETTEQDIQRSIWQELIKSWIIKKYHSALVGGRPQKRYLEKLGMPSDAIFTGYNSIENSVFHPHQIYHLSPPQKQPYFLAINRFIPKKNLSFLVNAYAAYRQEVGTSSAWDLILCGDGPLYSEIGKLILKLDLRNVVHLTGFLQQDELLPYFAHASCFIHTSSHEQWGLVVNEAMSAGLPTLVSNRCGCFEDLVIEGVTGFGFAPDDSQQLIELMLKVSSGNVDLVKMGNNALKHIESFAPYSFAHGLAQSVDYALSSRSL